MNGRQLLSALVLVACVCVLASPALAEKVPNLSKAKFKDIAKYLSLTLEQQERVRTDVERIQEIVKQAEKQSSEYSGSGPRVPVGGRGVFGPGGQTGGAGVTTGHGAEVRMKRQEWQREINNRVEEIKTALTPPQAEKFRAMQVPDLLVRR